MTLTLRTELVAAAEAAVPSSDLVTRSRQLGRRRLVVRRRRALVGAGVAVAAVGVGAITMPGWWTESPVSRAGETPSALATPVVSTTAAPAGVVNGTAADWLAALERTMPYSYQIAETGLSAERPTDLSASSHVQAVFRYTGNGGPTNLVVTAFASEARASAGPTSWSALLASCHDSGITCDPVLPMSTGPVLARYNAFRKRVDALSLRASGVVLEASAFVSPAAAATTPASTIPGTVPTLDRLVAIAAAAPEPGLAGG